MYIAPAQGQRTPWGQKLDANRKALSLYHLLQGTKKSLSTLILYKFLMFFPRVYSPGTGVDNPWGQSVDVNRKAISLCPLSVSFKNISLKSDLMNIFA